MAESWGRHLVGLCRLGLRKLHAAQNHRDHKPQRTLSQERGVWQEFFRLPGVLEVSYESGNPAKYGL